MNVNQHNYEEFFLLYVDGELSVADKQAVEQFVQANPGLAEELEMLLQMRLTDNEPVLFEGKESLFRNEASEINLYNHEERFLLYVDNELDIVSKEKVETFVLQHPALQESFTLLKQTRLEPETIVFPDKASLYRNEGKEKPVFYLRWQRMAVAAALIGFAVLVWTIFPADKASDQNTATLELKNGDALQKKTAVAVTANDKTPTSISKKGVENIAANTTIITQQKGIDKNKAAPITLSIENNDRNINSLLAQNNTDATSGGMKREEIISNPVDAGEKTQFSQKTPSANATLANIDMVKADHTEETDNTERIAQQTIYKELDTEDEKKSLYLGSLEINKDKLRGFFRKAGSLFRGKAKQQEEEKTESATPSTTRSLK